MVATFDELVRLAAGHDPYPFQRRLAEEGLPDVLRVPTGAGKTLAATLPWVWRRRFHPDPAVREATPHWLVLVLPMRVLVEQTIGFVRQWVVAAGLAEEIGVHRVMGGEGKIEGAWRLRPERDAVFVGTVDMLLSRVLNRGYGESRFAWPIDFGLFNTGTQWVFDEVQLLGPALPTSRQLHGLRRVLGTGAPCSSMWMSATVDEAALLTVDCAEVGVTVDLGDDDRAGPLGRRLSAAKTVHRLHHEPDARGYPAAVASGLADRHQAGTRTIAVLNTVERARFVATALDPLTTAEVVLLHSRFRPPDRARRVAEALADPIDPNGPGRIVVSTQVLEAGVDTTSTTMLTELAPWPSIVQRAGRCNRDGVADGAVLLWCQPPDAPPYDEVDLAASAAALEGLEGEAVTGPELGSQQVEARRPVHPVLRRTDLLGLFDTAPDLTGNDLDVGRFIREGDDLDVAVAWWPLTATGPEPNRRSPVTDELCPVPIGQVRKALKSRVAWRFDHLARAWVECRESDVRPGQVLVMRSGDGGYTPRYGWDPASKVPVEPVDLGAEEPHPLTEPDERVDDDRISQLGQWVPLARHLAEVEAAVREIVDRLHLPGISSEQREAAAVAARLHDLGKVHPEFQDMLARTTPEARRAAIPEGPWAKSGGDLRVRNRRRNFRHELASALALLGEASVALDGVAERDLVVYLVAAHHGRVRLSIRSLPKEGPETALGVHNGEELPSVLVPGAHLPAATLDLSVMKLGDGAGSRPSWSRRALGLRDRPDLGPFRLGLLEALVRLADWRASAGATEVAPEGSQ